MSTPPTKIVPPPVYRNPLGLPAGSVRALLTLGIVGMFLFYVLSPSERPMPISTYALLPMVLLFYVAHGHSIRRNGEQGHSPLWLPTGVLRIAIAVGIIAAIAWQYRENPDALLARLTPTPEQLPQAPYVLAALAMGFLIGQLFRVGPWRHHAAFQDFTAWVSLIAMFGLIAELVIEFLIRPGMLSEWTPLTWECILTGILSFYFSVRS